MKTQGNKIRTANPINVTPLSEKAMLNKYVDRVRKGKTAKDKARRKGDNG